MSEVDASDTVPESVRMPEPQVVVGRDDEIETISAFLARAPADGLTALVLEGEAGIGKTALWHGAVEQARRAGEMVLASALARGEAQLSFAALADLVESVWPAIVDELAVPQRAALEHALALREGGSSPPDERAVAFGFLGIVRALAGAGQVTIAIDDVQWLDHSSLAMLRYALRRLRAEPVRLIVTRRLEDGGDPDPLRLARIDGLPVERLTLGPLTLGALHRALRERLGHPLTRPALSRIHTASHGNPLHALELARETETIRAEPGSLAALMRGRVLELPLESQKAMLLTALSADPSIAMLQRAGVASPKTDLAAAIDANVLTIDAGAVRFSHPLLASAAVEVFDEVDRRWAHAALADGAESDEERARHLGRATTTPDEAIAAALESAAVVARQRGALAVSAQLLVESAELTPVVDDDRRGRRLLDAGHSCFAAGDIDKARSLFQTLVTAFPESAIRVEARWRLGTVLDETGDVAGAIRLWQEALAATDDRRLTSIIERGLTYSTMYTEGLDAAARHAEAAVTSAESCGDSGALAFALAASAIVAVLQGSPDYEALLERALRLDSGLDVLGEWCPVEVSAECGRLTGEIARTRTLYEAVLSRAAETGETGSEQWAAFGLTSTELLAGRLGRARELLGTVLDLTDQTGLMQIPGAGLAVNVAAHAGDLDEARALALETIAKARDAHEHMYELNLLHGLGFIEASAGDHTAAAATYELARSLAATHGVRNIAVQRAALHEAESAATAGLADQAALALASFDREPVPPAARWLDGVRSRAVATITARSGDERDARAILTGALEHADPGAPLELGRTHLLRGVLLRRAREHSAARASLESAITIFDEIGARAWAATATTELERIPGRTRGPADELTDAEQRIADLVVTGRSNKEVAAALHLSVKTVEVTLTRVYRKLGVRSRGELAARFAQAR